MQASPRSPPPSPPAAAGTADMEAEHVATTHLNTADPHLVTTSLSSSSCLHIVVERVRDGASWAASFDAPTVDTLTTAAGAARPFPASVRLIRAAVEGGPGLDAVLLSPADVARSGEGAASASPPPPSPDRRYLVVTRKDAFDAATYPLPLAPEPDAQAAARLRRVVSSFRSAPPDPAAADAARWKAEADALRTALAASEAAAEAACAALAQRAESAEAEAASLRTVARRTARDAAARVADAEAAAAAAKGDAVGARVRARAAAGALSVNKRVGAAPPPRFDPTAYVAERAAKAAASAAEATAARRAALKVHQPVAVVEAITPPPRGPSLPPRKPVDVAAAAGAELEARLDALRGFLESARKGPRV